jgi:hypothetical protein
VCEGKRKIYDHLYSTFHSDTEGRVFYPTVTGMMEDIQLLFPPPWTPKRKDVVFVCVSSN